MPKTLEVTAHWNICLCGENADEVNLVELVKEYIESQKLKLVITSAHNSTHYRHIEPEKQKTSK